MTVCTPRRRGVPFVRTKGTKIRSRGTDSPLTNPFLSLAVLDTNDAEASSVLRTDTLSRCLRRILFGGSRDQIKITPYKRRLIPLREYEVFPGGGAPTRGGLGVLPE